GERAARPLRRARGHREHDPLLGGRRRRLHHRRPARRRWRRIGRSGRARARDSALGSRPLEKRSTRTMQATKEQITFSGGRASGPLPISQIAIVVRDIDDALEKYARVLGWGPWNVYEHKPPSL